MRNEVNGLGGGPTRAPPPPSTGRGSRGGPALGERRCWALCISLAARGKGRRFCAPRKVWHVRSAELPPLSRVGRVAYVAGRRGGEPSWLGIGSSGPEIRLVGFSTQQAGPPDDLRRALRASASLPPSFFSCARCPVRNGPEGSATTGSSSALETFRCALAFGLKGKRTPTSRAPTPAFPKWAPSSCVGFQDRDGLGRWEVWLHLSSGRSLEEVALCSGVSPVELGGYSPVLLGRSYPGSTWAERNSTLNSCLEFRVEFPNQCLQI